MTKKRYTEIDMARGLGIILVVLGHALKQTGELEGAPDVLLNVIYSFHMPLFFALSGFTAAKCLGMTDCASIKAFAANRSRRLLVPYFAMGLLYMPVKLIMSRYAVKPYTLSDTWRILIGENPNTALWFVYVLFLCSIAAACLVTERNLKASLCVSFVLSASMYAFGMDIRFFKYFFFFLLGIYIRRNYESIRERIGSTGAAAVSLVIFAAGNALLYRGIGVCTMVTALSGSCLVYAFACRLSPERRSAAAVKLCGEYSMDIYIFSEPIMTAVRLVVWNILGMSQGISIAVCFVGSIVTAIPVSMYIVRRIKPLRVLFLGMD